MLHTELIAPIHVLLERHAAARGTKIAYRDAHGAVSYAALRERTGNLAGHLADLGVGEKETVAILLPNGVAWVETCFAIARAGAISVPISYDATEPEIAYRLADASCRAIVTTAEHADLVAKLKAGAPFLSIVVLHDEGAKSAQYETLATTRSKSTPRDPDDIHSPAFILYTSGTTGRAKGVLLTVHGMLWIVAACWAPIAGLSERDTVLSPLPLFHSYALNLSVLGVLATGASEYVVEKFSVSEAVKLLRSGEFTVFPGVPTMFHYLLQATRDENGIGFPNLRLCISAGAIMPATLNREFEERFGVPLLDGYGITETSTMVTMNWPTGSRVLGSCGFPVPGLAVRIVDAVHARDVAPGEEGELIVRGPERDARLSQQAGGNRKGAAQRLVSHRRSGAERRERLPHHHGAAEGADHPRRAEHRAGRDRGGGEYVSAGARLRSGRRAARFARRSAGAVRGGAQGAGDRDRRAARALPRAALRLQGSARGASDRVDPAHRIGQDHPLQAARER